MIKVGCQWHGLRNTCKICKHVFIVSLMLFPKSVSMRASKLSGNEYEQHKQIGWDFRWNKTLKNITNVYTFWTLFKNMRYLQLPLWWAFDYIFCWCPWTPTYITEISRSSALGRGSFIASSFFCLPPAFHCRSTGTLSWSTYRWPL